MSIKGSVAIVGASESTEIGVVPGMSAIQLHADAALNAIADCGIDIREIDGIASTGPRAVEIAKYLGIIPSYVDATGVGGCSFLLHVRHAAAAIAAGLCNVVLITHGESGRSRVGNGAFPADPQDWRGQFEAPYGTFGPTSTFPMGVLRYMKDFGLTHEQLASVSVSQRQWAQMNPRAMMRDPITVEDVLASRLVAYPLHLLECCLVTDGGGALVVTSSERACDMDLRHTPVYVAGTGEAAETSIISQMNDFTTSEGFRLSGRRAFAESGLSHADIDHLMLYDAFAFLPIYALEDLGFVGRGEAGAFFAEGLGAPGGTLPTNTNGGGMSYTHTGMYGMFLVQESIRQLRGTAAAQLPDVQVSLAHGPGGMFGAAGTLILTNQQL